VVSLAANLAIFCLTTVALVLMLAISWWVVSFCEKTLKVDLLDVGVLVIASNLLIIGHFAFYLAYRMGL
jgi:hypothetical protein